MAGSTYGNLVNRLLRRINDVEIRESDFASVKGVQAAAKDAIVDTLREINTSRIDWPFNSVTTNQVLTVGTEEYSWPDGFNTADWNSFYIEKDDGLNVSTTPLRAISREQWFQSSKPMDLDSGTDGRGLPYFVFPASGHGFGVTPSPPQAYSVKYDYYTVPDDPSNFTDEFTIPR